MSRGILFVLSGPSGAGKGTLRRLLFQRLPGLAYSVSCTTRQPRPGETEGVEYHFVSEEAFREMIAQGIRPPRVMATIPLSGPFSTSRQASALASRCNWSQVTV